MNRSSSKVPVVVGIIVVLFLLPTIYVLSVGPACYLFETGVISEGTLLTVYAPIHWLAKKSTTFGSFIEWYGWLWTPTKQGGP